VNTCACVGHWGPDNLKGPNAAVLTFEVTDRIEGPGTYTVTLCWTKGAWGLGGQKVELLSAAKDHPDQLTVEATDAHTCHAGAWVQGNVYTLPLANLDPQRVYQVRLTASASNDSFGDVYFRKAK